MKVLRQVRRGGISKHTHQVLKERIVEDNFEIEGDMKPTIIYANLLDPTIASRISMTEV